MRAIPATTGATDTLWVDLGVLALATCSDGTVIPGPKALHRGLRRLRHLSRAHRRKRRGSRNRAASARRLTRHHARIAALRRDHLHTRTTALAKTHRRIVVEDLNVRGMLGNRRLARSLADSGFAEFRRQLAYTCGWHGSTLVTVDGWFASAKRCSACATVTAALSLRERTYQCDACGLVIDRDRNAAITLVWWAAPPVVTAGAAETETACGAARKPRPRLAGGWEAGTGIAPEPTGSTGGHPSVSPFVTAG